MSTRGNYYKEKIMLMLDAGYKNKDIIKTVGCSQGFVSRIKIKWESMGESQKRREIKLAEGMLGEAAKKYQGEGKPDKQEEQEPAKPVPGFRTPYTAMKSGRTVITRY